MKNCLILNEIDIHISGNYKNTFRKWKQKEDAKKTNVRVADSKGTCYYRCLLLEVLGSTNVGKWRNRKIKVRFSFLIFLYQRKIQNISDRGVFIGGLYGPTNM